jgi:wyosine [tRNA(Phe)-imidazoG37] synthetase (radical SAM superfamily)
MDVAFSGNGEPTSAPEFAQAVERVGLVLARFGLAGKLPVRLITNGSLLFRPEVQRGIRMLGDISGNISGEVWFKLDRAEPDAMTEVNGIPAQIDKVARHLEICAGLAPTWVQTCWFALDGQPPGVAAENAYCDLLKPLAGQLSGIHLYGLARPSMQVAAPRLTRLPPEALAAFGEKIEKKTGIRVLVSP